MQQPGQTLILCKGIQSQSHFSCSKMQKKDLLITAIVVVALAALVVASFFISVKGMVVFLAVLIPLSVFSWLVRGIIYLKRSNRKKN